MKGNELMIGDIVAVNNTPLQIAALGTAKAGFLDARGEMFYHYYDNMAPIPLTAKILEKNFRADKQWGESGWFINDHIHIYQTTSGVYNIQYMEIVDIRYIHELQHALKLCGIEKTIEL